MTTISLKHTDHYSIDLEGHTDTDVCAGVSALAYGIAGYLINSGLKVEQIRLDSGISHIGWYGCRELFRFAEIAFRQIEIGYPGRIMVVWGENESKK